MEPNYCLYSRSRPYPLILVIVASISFKSLSYWMVSDRKEHSRSVLFLALVSVIVLFTSVTGLNEFCYGNNRRRIDSKRRFTTTDLSIVLNVFFSQGILVWLRKYKRIPYFQEFFFLERMDKSFWPIIIANMIRSISIVFGMESTGSR